MERDSIAHRELVSTIFSILNRFHLLVKLQVIVKGKVIEWLQIRVSTPVFGLYFKKWELKIEQTGKKLVQVKRADKKAARLLSGSEVAGDHW